MNDIFNIVGSIFALVLVGSVALVGFSGALVILKMALVFFKGKHI